MKRYQKLMAVVSSSILFTIPAVSQIPVAYASPIVDRAYMKPMYGESNKTTVVKTEYTYHDVEPDGQNPGGRKATTNGEMISVNSGGGHTVNVSLGVSWEVVSAGISVGTVVGGSASHSIAIPNDGHYYKVMMRKNLIVQRLKIDFYSYGKYQYTIYSNRVLPNGEYLYLKMIR